MKAKTIIGASFGIFLFFLIQTTSASDLADVFVEDRTVYLIENEEITISFIQDLEVDQNGGLWIIDWDTSELYKFDAQGKHGRVVATKGKGPGELMIPESIWRSDSGDVFIVDFSRKVSRFASNGHFVDAFIVPKQHYPNTCIAVGLNNRLYIGGRPKRDGKGVYSGDALYMYTLQGDFIKSFLPVTKTIREKIWGAFLASR